jgi:hypothetical protein
MVAPLQITTFHNTLEVAIGYDGASSGKLHNDGDHIARRILGIASPVKLWRMCVCQGAALVQQLWQRLVMVITAEVSERTPAFGVMSISLFMKLENYKVMERVSLGLMIVSTICWQLEMLRHNKWPSARGIPLAICHHLEYKIRNPISP